MLRSIISCKFQSPIRIGQMHFAVSLEPHRNSKLKRSYIYPRHPQHVDDDAVTRIEAAAAAPATQSVSGKKRNETAEARATRSKQLGTNAVMRRRREPFPSLHVYLDMMSQPCRSLALYLHLTATPHTVHYLRLARFEHRTPALAELNPAQKLPAAAFFPADAPTDAPLLHGMGESVAIVRLVDSLRRLAGAATPALDRLYPADGKDGLYARARVDEVLDFYHTTLRLGCGLVTRQYLFKLPAVQVRPEDDPQLALGLKTLREALRRMETMVGKDGSSFLAGTAEASIADIFCAVELFHVVGRIGPLPFLDVAVEYPRIQRWMERVAEVSSWDDVHEVFYAARQRLLTKLQQMGEAPLARL